MRYCVYNQPVLQEIHYILSSKNDRLDAGLYSRTLSAQTVGRYRVPLSAQFWICYTEPRAARSRSMVTGRRWVPVPARSRLQSSTRCSPSIGSPHRDEGSSQCQPGNGVVVIYGHRTPTLDRSCWAIPTTYLLHLQCRAATSYYTDQFQRQNYK